MKLFSGLYERVMAWSRHRHAPRYLATVSFAESSFFPVPVAVMLLPMTLAQRDRAWNLATLTLVFSVLGGIFGYIIGATIYELVEPLFSRYEEQMQLAQEWFGRYGVWVVLMAGFSPIPYKIFTITSGALSMAFIPFVIASIFGRASQFYLIAALAYWLGPRMEPKIRQYVEWLGWASVVIIGGLLLWLNLR